MQSDLPEPDRTFAPRLNTKGVLPSHVPLGEAHPPTGPASQRGLFPMILAPHRDQPFRLLPEPLGGNLDRLLRALSFNHAEKPPNEVDVEAADWRLCHWRIIARAPLDKHLCFVRGGAMLP
jgi:hypothetical protein